MPRPRGLSIAVGVVATLAIGVALFASGPSGSGPAPAPSPSPPPSPSRPPTGSPSLSPMPSESPSPAPTPPVEPFAWGPTQADWEAALATARDLPVERAAGQVIVASYAGTSPDDLDAMVRKYGLGGVMLHGDATSTRKVTKGLTAAAESAGQDRDWPVMIAVDQEGGVVARLRGMMPDMPGFMAAGAATDKSSVTAAYENQGARTAALGFNTNFAPVADVTSGLSDPVIRTRSAGSDPDNVAATVNAAVRGYTEAGLVTTIKHFPGHGSVEVDSHEGLPVQSASVADLGERDLIPFASAIDAGAPAVMIGHIALKEWGGDAASLAPGAYAYLRDELDFTGVAITDAMNMGAIVDHHKPGEATVLALKAGADMVLMPADTGAAVAAVVDAVRSGELPRARLDEAAARTIVLMRWQEGLDAAPVPPDSRDYASAFAAHAATLVTPSCEKAVLSDSSGKVTITGGREGERKTLSKALARRGIHPGSEKEPGTTIRLVGDSTKSVSADVVVALAGPWVLDKAKATTFVALYGRSDDALRGLAEVLVGDATSDSAWPVPLKNMPSDPC